MYLHDHIVGGDFASYKPDFVYGPSVGPKLQKWEFAGACGEMKKHEVTKMPTEHARTITNDRLRKFKLDWVDRERTRDETSSTSVPVIPQRRRKRKATVQPISRANKKVKMGKVAAPAPVTHIDTKYLVDFTGEEIQMAKYVNELLSHGIRTYAFGFLLRETSMSLWYVDRMGMASSKSFDIFKSPELLLLVVGALNFADRHSLGFNPLVEYPKGATQSHDGAILKLPHAIRDDGTAVASPVKFDIRISRTSPLVVAYGAVGRGTTVIPIRAKGSARKLWGEGNLVAKLSWPSINRKNEADTIRVVRKKLGEHDEARAHLRHIVELKCSSELSAMDMKLPRAFMDLREPHEPRVFRALVMKEYLPLERIASLEEFKTVYIHVIDAHYWVHKVVGILHRDPCADNIMFYYDDKHDVVGVLSDWDVSIQKELTYLRDVPDTEDAVEEEEDPTPPRPHSNSDSDTTRRPRYRTGRGAFMAIDLLSPVPVTHRYRHDLESFFYLLCYFCARFRRSTPENPQAYLAYLLDWENGSMAKISLKKQGVLLGGDVFFDLFNDADEAYRPLIDQWIEPLRRNVFGSVLINSLRLTQAYANLAAARRRNDNGKEQLSLKEVQGISEEADEAVSYEVFRDILNG
ncbi:hypothetical protein QCA50_012400 [Cerrena zonata]|uniref:Fungal-type protein kinase domain-containing protein n=1 Tax=Cerrena zonata TaxID=2478898 RepID=A0AAW0G3E5_9APHY